MQLEDFIRRGIDDYNKSLSKDFFGSKLRHFFNFGMWFKARDKYVILFILLASLGIGFKVLGEFDFFDKVPKYAKIPLAIVVGFFCFHFLMMIIGVMFANINKKNSMSIAKKYADSQGFLHFDSEEISGAAYALRNFKQQSYKEAVEQFGQKSVDILAIICVLSQSRKGLFAKDLVDINVSIDAIETDEQEV